MGEGKAANVSQNTREAGVFLSDSALAMEKKHAGGMRKLLAFADCVECVTSLRPLEIATFIVQLEPTADAGAEVTAPRQRRLADLRPVEPPSEAILAQVAHIEPSKRSIEVEQMYFIAPRASPPKREARQPVPTRDASALHPLIVVTPVGARLPVRPLAGTTIVPLTVSVHVSDVDGCSGSVWTIDGKEAKASEFDLAGVDANGLPLALGSVLEASPQPRSVRVSVTVQCSGAQASAEAVFNVVSEAGLAALELKAMEESQMQKLNAKTTTTAPTTVNGTLFVAIDAATTRWLEMTSFAIFAVSGVVILAALAMIERSGRRALQRRTGGSSGGGSSSRPSSLLPVSTNSKQH